MSNERAAAMATEWWAARLMSGDVDKFKEALRPLILEKLEKEGVCYLDCDYDPHEPLLTAVRAAGIECRGFMFSAYGILPQKHSLKVFPHELKPKEGYGNWLNPIPVPE